MSVRVGTSGLKELMTLLMRYETVLCSQVTTDLLDTFMFDTIDKTTQELQPQLPMTFYNKPVPALQNALTTRLVFKMRILSVC